MAHEFIRAWARFRTGPGPQILDGDDLLLEGGAAQRITVQHPSWKHFLRGSDFGNHDRRLHLSLIPQPFLGNVDSAPVVILGLNPGLKPVDYFGEFLVKRYRRALLANLRLGFKNSRFPNLFLNPAFSWHSGFTYWHGRLARLIDAFAAEVGLRRVDALSFFSRSIAMLELVPYHSISFRLSDRFISRLHSVQLVWSFLKEVLVPRARASETLLVVTRHARQWGLRQGSGVIVYRAGEARAGYLTPSSRGGSCILKHLLPRAIRSDSVLG